MSLVMLSKKDPEVLKSLYSFRRKVFKDGALSAKEKELIALALSCSVKCEKCFEHHAEEAKKCGATEDEMLEAIEVAMYLTGPSAMIWTEKIDEFIDPRTYRDN